MNTKNLITWKDADQNLIAVAAYMIDEASLAIRGYRPAKSPVMTTGGEPIAPGYGEDDSKRTILSGNYDPDAIFKETNELEPCIQCFWCFKNIVMQNLKIARAELVKNLYAQKRKSTVSRQISRNPKGRKRGTSKYKRQQER